MTKRLLISLVLMLAAVSCGRIGHTRPEAEREISLVMQTKALEPKDVISSRILIAKSEDYVGIASSGLANPYYSCLIDNIFEWNGSLYNTRTPYPEDDSRVYVFGYAPADVLTTTDSWKSLLPLYRDSEYDNSIWEDVLLCGPVSGKLSSHVNESLVYTHQVARFKFLAFKEESMLHYHVKNVRLSADPSLLPYDLAWNGTLWQARSGAGAELGFTFKVPETGVDILGIGLKDAIEMYPYYFLPQNGNIIGPFSLEATYYIDGDSSLDKTHRKDNIYFQIASDRNGDPVSRIRAGEDYVLMIRFNQDSFTLSGIRVDDWEDGGNIIIPIINETTDWR